MSIVIRDNKKRKYELHRAGLIERPARGRNASHLILRRDLKNAFERNLRVIPVQIPYGFTEHTLIFTPKGRVKIGCRLFLRSEGRKLQKWANN